jgi:LPS-assembly lipoprotein
VTSLRRDSQCKLPYMTPLSHPGRLTRRATLLLACAASLTALVGCGFRPLYGQMPGSLRVTEELARVRVPPIPDRPGQILRNNLLDRLTPRGEPREAAYVLEVRLAEPRQTLALRRDDVISRFAYSANAGFNLRDASGRIVFSGSSGFSTDYEVTNSEFATLSSRENARVRVLELIADDIRSQLAEYMISPRP